MRAAILALLAGGMMTATLGSTMPPMTGRQDVDVAIRTFQFAPDTIRVKAGARVVWTNADEIEHTVTSGTPDKPDGRFNGVVDKRGATYSATLEKPGTYAYFCDRHRFMNGTVIVTK